MHIPQFILKYACMLHLYSKPETVLSSPWGNIMGHFLLYCIHSTLGWKTSGSKHTSSGHVCLLSALLITTTCNRLWVNYLPQQRAIFSSVQTVEKLQKFKFWVLPNPFWPPRGYMKKWPSNFYSKPPRKKLMTLSYNKLFICFLNTYLFFSFLAENPRK